MICFMAKHIAKSHCLHDASFIGDLPDCVSESEAIPIFSNGWRFLDRSKFNEVWKPVALVLESCVQTSARMLSGVGTETISDERA